MIPLGTTVLVTKLKKHGIVTEDLGNGTYKVTIGALSIRVKEKEVTVTAQAKKESKESSPGPSSRIGIESDALRAGSALQKLDLHGLTVAEALRLLEEHISRAVLAGLNEVEVMHGIGSGKLHDAVQKHLRTLPAVKSFQLNPYNRGVTRVFL